MKGKPENSEVIVYKTGGASYIGPDAVKLLQARTLVMALRLYAKSGMRLTRGAPPSKLLELASKYSRKKYSGRDKYQQAADDVEKWATEMQAALPISMEGDKNVG